MHRDKITAEAHHGHTLAGDLAVLTRLARRRRALAWRAALSGAPLLDACGGGGSGETTTATPAAVASSTSGTSATASTTAACIADPAETAGPFPAKGTNTAAGATSDILTASGIVRADIRSSFPTSTTTAPGVVTKLTLTLVNPNSVCSTLHAAVCNVAYPGATGYSQSITNFAQVSVATDGVSGDDTAAQITAMTPATTGSVADGYVAKATVGIAR